MKMLPSLARQIKTSSELYFFITSRRGFPQTMTEAERKGTIFRSIHFQHLPENKKKNITFNRK